MGCTPGNLTGNLQNRAEFALFGVLARFDRVKYQHFGLNSLFRGKLGIAAVKQRIRSTDIAASKDIGARVLGAKLKHDRPIPTECQDT